MGQIRYDDFLKVDVRVGTVTRVEPFPEARKPACKLYVDFGPDIGERKSSAQVTRHYTPEGLVGRQVAAVVNLPPRQIGPFRGSRSGISRRRRRCGADRARPPGAQRRQTVLNAACAEATNTTA